MSVVGHKRHIRRVRATSAFPPLATKLLPYGNRRSRPYPEVLLRRQPEFSELSRAFQFEVRSTSASRLNSSKPWVPSGRENKSTQRSWSKNVGRGAFWRY